MDLTYGEGKLWGAFRAGTVMEDYHLLTNDVDETSPADYHVVFDDIVRLWHFYSQAKAPGENVKANGVIYDPPYLYGRSSHYLITPEEKDLDWKPQKTKWTIRKQKEAARILNLQLPKILAPDGVVIVKIMNSRLKGKLIKNTRIIEAAFSNFEEKAEFIYVRTNVGFYRSSKTPQTAHGFYLVFGLKQEARGI